MGAGYPACKSRVLQSSATFPGLLYKVPRPGGLSAGVAVVPERHAGVPARGVTIRGASTSYPKENAE